MKMKDWFYLKMQYLNYNSNIFKYLEGSPPQVGLDRPHECQVKSLGDHFMDQAVVPDGVERPGYVKKHRSQSFPSLKCVADGLRQPIELKVGGQRGLQFSREAVGSGHVGRMEGLLRSLFCSSLVC